MTITNRWTLDNGQCHKRTMDIVVQLGQFLITLFFQRLQFTFSLTRFPLYIYFQISNLNLIFFLDIETLFVAIFLSFLWLASFTSTLDSLRLVQFGPLLLSRQLTIFWLLRAIKYFFVRVYACLFCTFCILADPVYHAFFVRSTTQDTIRFIDRRK